MSSLAEPKGCWGFKVNPRLLTKLRPGFAFVSGFLWGPQTNTAGTVILEIGKPEELRVG